jgi:hypothetical protein
MAVKLHPAALLPGNRPQKPSWKARILGAFVISVALLADLDPAIAFVRTAIKPWIS